MAWGSSCITGNLAAFFLSSLAVCLSLHVEQGLMHFQKSDFKFKNNFSVPQCYKLTGENT